MVNCLHLKDFIDETNDNIFDSSFFIALYGINIKTKNDIELDRYNNIIKTKTSNNIKLIEDKNNININYKNYYLVCKKIKFNKNYYENYNYKDIFNKLTIKHDEFLIFMNIFNYITSLEDFKNVYISENFWFLLNYDIKS